MNQDNVDFESWEVATPPSAFADRVMDAVMAEAHRSRAVPRVKRSLFRMSVLGVAAAVAAGSFTVFAMFGRSRSPASSPIPPSAAPAPVYEGAPSIRTDVRHAAGTVVDRKLRETVRARLMVPLAALGVERDPHTGLTIPRGTNGPSHNLSREYLEQRIREDFYPMAIACYEAALADTPTLAGKVVVDFMIVGDTKVGGIVDQAKINDRTTIADTKMTDCLRESMLSMVFAAPDNDGWVTVTYPFVFAPDGDGADQP
ncbi:MAG: AgmX/PglI C-terminal domain-containing protein [Polyangiaceae bacterium]